jgi:Lon protease-like protein
MHSEAIIPIFPLGLVLLPEMPLTLHIFEERYKLMTKECIAQNKEFGIVYFNGKQFESVGCTARIVTTLKQYNDGRLDIATRGVNRFHLKELYDEKPYLQAKAEFFDDELEENLNAEISQEFVDRGVHLLKKINKMTEQYNAEVFTTQLDRKAVSFLIAACDGFSFEEKQRFLEMTSTINRLRQGVEALEKLLERIKINQEIHRIMGGNGNFPEHLQTRLKRN